MSDHRYAARPVESAGITAHYGWRIKRYRIHLPGVAYVATVLGPESTTAVDDYLARFHV